MMTTIMETANPPAPPALTMEQRVAQLERIVERLTPKQNYTLEEAAEFLRKTPNQVWSYAKRSLVDHWYDGSLAKDRITFTHAGLIRFAENLNRPAIQFSPCRE